MSGLRALRLTRELELSRVFVAAAANDNVASDCPGSAVVPGYSVTLCTSLLGPGEQVTLVLSEGRWEDVELLLLVLIGACGEARQRKGGQWRRVKRTGWDSIVIVSVRCWYRADTHYHSLEKPMVTRICSDLLIVWVSFSNNQT